jgi:hypothetical protein
MASRKVDIQISTTADTTGAKQTEAAIGSIEQKQADLAAAQKKASERRVEQQAKELKAEKEAQQAAQDSARLRLAAGAALAASARQVAALTVDVIRQYKELGVELRGFESIGLEFADFLTSPFEYVVDAFTGYKADLVALKESQRRVIEQERIYQDTLKAKREEIRAENEAYVKGALARELQVIDQITAAYERQKLEIDAANKAREATIRAIEDVAMLEGEMSPEQVSTARRGREQASRQAEVNNTVVDAAALFQEASERAEAAISAYSAAHGLNLEASALAAEADAAVAARDRAQLDLESVKNVAASASAELASAAVSEQTGVVESTMSALTSEAKKAKEELERQAQAEGANFVAGGKEALRLLQDSLADGVIDESEINAVRVAIEQAKGASIKLNSDVLAGFQSLEKANNVAIENQRLMNQRLQQQALRLESIESRLRSGN